MNLKKLIISIGLYIVRVVKFEEQNAYNLYSEVPRSLFKIPYKIQNWLRKQEIVNMCTYSCTYIVVEYLRLEGTKVLCVFTTRNQYIEVLIIHFKVFMKTLNGSTEKI